MIHFIEDDTKWSEVEAKRAIELNPSLPEPYRMQANVTMLGGEVEEGIRLWEAAYRLDPVRPRYIERLGSILFLSWKRKRGTSILGEN